MIELLKNYQTGLYEIRDNADWYTQVLGMVYPGVSLTIDLIYALNNCRRNFFKVSRLQSFVWHCYQKVLEVVLF